MRAEKACSSAVKAMLFRAVSTDKIFVELWMLLVAVILGKTPAEGSCAHNMKNASCLYSKFWNESTQADI